MKKKKLDPKYNFFAAPHPTVVAGTFVNNKPTYTTLGDFGILCAYPLHVYIASVYTHYLNIGIKENMTYSVNIPNQDNLVKTDYVGIVSGHKTDKSKVFDYFDKFPIDSGSIWIRFELISNFLRFKILLIVAGKNFYSIFDKSKTSRFLNS